MKVDTRWFGTIDIDDEKIITFDLGVIGFEDCKKFTLIYDVDKGDEASIMWLQSLDEPEIALPMLKPELIKEDYDPIVEDEMLKALGSDIKDADLIVFCVLTVPADITKMTINLKAPIIVNADTLKGVQLIADNNCAVDCDSSRRRLRDGDQIQHFLIIDPVILVHKFLFHECNDHITAAKSEGTQIKGRNK